MRVTLQRNTFTNESTIGKLYVNNVYKCYTREDCSRLLSFHSSALPVGEYALITEYSEIFNTRVIKIVGEKLGIFHPMTDKRDIKSSIKLGLVRYRNNVAEDTMLFRELYDLVREAETNDETAILTICI